MTTGLAAALGWLAGWYIPEWALNWKRRWFIALLAVSLALILSVALGLVVAFFLAGEGQPGFGERMARAVAMAFASALIASIWSAIKFLRREKAMNWISQNSTETGTIPTISSGKADEKTATAAALSIGGTKFPPLNYRTGLFRIWVVASVLWTIGCLLAALDAWSIWRNAAADLAAYCATLPPEMPPPPDGFCLDGPELDRLSHLTRYSWENFVEVLAALTFPLMFLAAAVATWLTLRWVVRGFHRGTA